MSDTVDTPSRNTRSRAWCFTLNNFSEEDVAQARALEGECVCGIETGENGTPHLQGVVRFESARTFQSVKKLLPRAHIEKCVSWVKSKQYCAKEGNLVRNLGDTQTHRVVKDPLEGLTLKPWQQEVALLLENEAQDTRTIRWYWEPTGNVGKTSLAKHLCIKWPKNILYLSGKAADIKFAVSGFVKKNTLKMAIFDLTRTSEQFVSYEALEAVKNGIFFSGKYEAEMCVFNSPHVVVFANFPPDTSRLSGDRWFIQSLSPVGETLVPSLTRLSGT